jgi:hypothetical protein
VTLAHSIRFDSLASLLLGDVVMRGLIKAVQKSARKSFVTFHFFDFNPIEQQAQR